jgi:hypothetical protein
LALGEAQRTASVSEIAVARRLQEYEQLLELLCRCRSTGLLSKCH